MTDALPLLRPDWPAPSNIHAFSTYRQGGISLPPYDSLNLGDHVGDDAQAVADNRQRLLTQAHLPAEPLWLQQVHGNDVIDARHWTTAISADASYSNQPDQVCTVLTADCLPVLFTDRSGRQVAAAHAGWRGLLAGVLEKPLACFSGRREDILVWLGPAIGPQQFEVGREVFEAFCERDNAASRAFQQRDADHFLADIYLLARQRLAQAGVTAVFGGEHCTVSEADKFYSYRRDGDTGRMASLIWISGK
ncbi:peptidoglycan editing factor PgeF [uncultured Methylophaga sp.]|uniref:peptidoglycan editing factor PgeF n=1 Tax=uncultured Methylophaga sp. TaxID=285271 RepID=UPI00260E4C93|nr:peptidoglycan editing factor PgeF [uncultured Methylophaga sp.]